ncbi:MAG TPA: hypothetical protein DCM28_05675, partial [Phycisphaerales bacterium]|nr:hypothetical protein [Phycisphaerales bacterium]
MSTEDPTQSSSKASTGRSEQAAQSLNKLLDQCETQRSQLDAFLAGFEKKVAGKTIIGQSVPTQLATESSTQIIAGEIPVSDNKQKHEDTQVETPTPLPTPTQRQVEAELSP